MTVEKKVIYAIAMAWAIIYHWPMLGHIQSGIAIRLFKSNQNKCTFLNGDSTALVSRLPIFWMPIHVQYIVLYTAGMWWLSSNPFSKQMDCFHNIPFFERELSASELHSNVTQPWWLGFCTFKSWEKWGWVCLSAVNLQPFFGLLKVSK